MRLGGTSNTQGAAKTQCQARLRIYRGDMASFRERLATAKASSGGNDAANRNELFSGASGGAWGDQASALDQRARLLRNTERMERSSEALASSERLSHETEALGHEILGQLGQQRETIMNTRSNLGHVNDNLSRSRRVVAAMQRRTVTNKVITAMIILGLVGVIVLIIYVSFAGNAS